MLRTFIESQLSIFGSFTTPLICITNRKSGIFFKRCRLISEMLVESFVAREKSNASAARNVVWMKSEHNGESNQRENCASECLSLAIARLSAEPRVKSSSSKEPSREERDSHKADLKRVPAEICGVIDRFLQRNLHKNYFPITQLSRFCSRLAQRRMRFPQVVRWSNLCGFCMSRRESEREEEEFA